MGRSIEGHARSDRPPGRTAGCFGPTSYQFATGKPLQLIDGTALLSLCHHHNIPARIIPRAS